MARDNHTTFRECNTLQPLRSSFNRFLHYGSKISSVVQSTFMLNVRNRVAVLSEVLTALLVARTKD